METECQSTVCDLELVLCVVCVKSERVERSWALYSGVQLLQRQRRKWVRNHIDEDFVADGKLMEVNLALLMQLSLRVRM